MQNDSSFSRRRRVVILTVVGLIATALVSLGQRPPDQNPITIHYFGMHIQHGAPWPSVPIGGWRVPVAWGWVEPQKGVWDFSKTDDYVATASQHGVELLFSLGYTAGWASSQPNKKSAAGPGGCAPARNIQDWRDYIKAIATRYKGRVKYYEVWNEPNIPAFWCGTTNDLVGLQQAAYQTLKAVDPDNQVISPSPVGQAGINLLNDFLAHGGAKYVDIVGFHFYFAPSPPESVFGEVREVRAVMAKNGLEDRPLWDTEDSWSGNRLDPDTNAAYVARALLLDRAAGASRIYWYEWGNQAAKLHMVEDDRKTLTPAGVALQVIQNWLIGAVLKSCSSSDIPAAYQASHAMWTCDLQRDGSIGKIVWNPDGNVPFKIPASWNVTYAHDIAGNTSVLPSNRQHPVGIKPYLFNQSR